MYKNLIACVLLILLSACAYHGMSASDKATVKYYDHLQRKVERYERKYPNDPFQPYYIKGMVLDEENNEPLIYSSIKITNSQLQAGNKTYHITDMDGHFVAIINDTLFNKNRKKISVLIQADGYQDSCYIIPYKSFKNNQLENTFFLKRVVFTLD
jgi:hypothetical protein